MMDVLPEEKKVYILFKEALSRINFNVKSMLYLIAIITKSTETGSMET